MNSSKDKSKPEYTLVKPPPHTITSVGKEEDSIQNCLQLQPKVPKRNLKKLLDYAGKVQLNKYETNPYFIQFFQRNRTICLIIHVFCQSCEPVLVFVLICILAEQFRVHKSYKTYESTLHCCALEILKKI